MSRIDDLIQQHCPDGVEYRALGDIAHYSDTRVSSDLLDNDTFVGVDNLLPDKRGRATATYRPNTAMLTGFGPGDVLLGNIRPYLRKVWLADRSGGCSGDVLAIRRAKKYEEAILPSFLYYVLSSERFFAHNNQNAKGAKMPRGSKDAILRFQLQVPPVEVQCEIVRVLDLFQSLEAELEAELEARRTQYAHYRNALLVSDEYATLGDVAEFKYGYTATAKTEGDYRFLRITDIDSRGKLSVDGARFVDANGGVDDYLVAPGDLLMARTGATYGKTMLVEDEQASVYASFLIRIRLDPRVMSPAYYWHFAQSRAYWAQVDALVSRGGQPQFNANVLRLLRVPTPALDEQSRVVAQLSAFDALADDLAVGLPAEIRARRVQYEYYRDRLLSFEEAVA